MRAYSFNNVVTIETEDGVTFALPLATPVTRFLAWIIDYLIAIAAVTVLSQALRPLAFISLDALMAITIIAYFVIPIAYGIVLEWWWGGQTFGKRAVGIRVMDASGLVLEPGQVVLRNLLRFVDILPGLYFVGGVAMIISKRYQRLGDRVASTIVVRRRRLTIPDIERIDLGERYNSLLEAPHLAARLRQNTPPDLANAAYEALFRRDELKPEARREIFSLLAAQFRSLVKFPEEITGSLTDERYVRNAVGILLAKQLSQRYSKVETQQRSPSVVNVSNPL